MACYIAGQLKCLNTLLISTVNCSSKVSGRMGRGCMASLGSLVKCMASIESPTHFQQKAQWIVPNLQVKSFCKGLPSASPSREAAGSCGEGEHLACTPKARLQCDVFYQSSIIFFAFKSEKKKRILLQNRIISFYITFSLGSLSNVYLFCSLLCSLKNIDQVKTN